MTCGLRNRCSGTKARQIPNSEYWVMVTFSNDDKKKVLRRVGANHVDRVAHPSI
jgi:negative regulator of replication initiation